MSLFWEGFPEISFNHCIVRVGYTRCTTCDVFGLSFLNPGLPTSKRCLSPMSAKIYSKYMICKYIHIINTYYMYTLYIYHVYMLYKNIIYTYILNTYYINISYIHIIYTYYSYILFIHIIYTYHKCILYIYMYVS